MRRILMLAAVLLVAVATGRTGAANVYRCVGADGAVSFQDQACRSGQIQRVVHLRDAPSAPGPVAVPPGANAPDMDAAAAPTTVAAPTTPAPDFFLCTRQDGSRYVSEDGRRGSSAVPISMLGLPESDLAQVYGGRNGIGVSAPGLRPIPQIPAMQAPFAGGYMWVDDACHHASAQEACAYLRGELDVAQDKLRRAFSDTEAQLKQQQRMLRERMRGC